MNRRINLNNLIKLKSPKLSKLPFKLNYFERLSVLTPSQVHYLEEYKRRVDKRDIKRIERIDSILKKEKAVDPILSYSIRVEPHYSERHERLYPRPKPKIVTQEEVKTDVQVSKMQSSDSTIRKAD